MIRINEYVEIMFQDFPKTKKTYDLKNNILDAMENRYLDLVNEGKAEDEAIDFVIGQFGNIDELKQEYDLYIEENLEYLATHEVEEYISFKRRFSTLIGIGVAMIILAAGLVVFYSDTILENPIIFLFMMIVSIAVAIFVFMGLQNAKYNNIDQAKYHLFDEDFAKYQEEYSAFKNSFNLAITIGVILCIFAGSSPILMEDILHLHENAFSIILFPFVALAVFLFIRFGILNGAYKRLVAPQEVRKTFIEEAQDHYSWINGITMPLATMVFLFFGFVYDAWHPAWIIFPTVAILTNGVVLVLNHSVKS